MPSSGQLNQAIANAVVRGHRLYVGRGPTRAHAFYHHNVVVVVMENALTQGERSLVESGRDDAVREMRHEFQEMMRRHLIHAVEELTTCTVSAALSATHIDPDVQAEVFLLDRPVPAETALVDG
jgi:uncharacterized protein YbcI